MKIVYEEGEYVGVLMHKQQLLRLAGMIGPTHKEGRDHKFNEWANVRARCGEEFENPPWPDEEEVARMFDIDKSYDYALKDPLSAVFHVAWDTVKKHRS